MTGEGTAGRLESRVRELEERLRKIREREDSSPIIIFDADVDGTLRSVNRTGYEVSGYTPEDLSRGLNMAQMIAPAQRDFAMENARRILFEGEKTTGHRYDFLRKDGTTFPVFIKAEAVMESGRPAGLTGFVLDISELHRAETQLQKERDDRESILDASGIGITVRDRRYNLLYANRVATDFAGKDILGRKCYAVFENLERVCDDCPVEKTFADGLSHTSLREVVDRATGEKSWWLNTSLPLRDGGGDLYACLEINRNHTEIVKAENTLRESKERLRSQGAFFQTIIESISDPLYVIDAGDYSVKMANSAARGKRKPEGLTCYAMTHGRAAPCGDDDNPCVIDVIRRTGKPIVLEHFHLDDEGRQRTFEVHGHPVFDEDGRLVQVVEFNSDITVRKFLEDQVQRNRRMDSLGTMAGGLAHDFNNLLAAIMGNIDLLRMDQDGMDQSQRDCIEEALGSTRKAVSLVEQLQALARGSVSAPVSLDLHDALGDALAFVEQSTGNLPGTRVEFDKGDFFVKADPSELNQVLVSLATNAVHAILEKGAAEGDFIRVRAGGHHVDDAKRGSLERGDYVHVLFQDSGCGMSEGVRKRAFDPLFTTKAKGPGRGTGLGLAMAHNLVTRRSGGSIDIETTPGKGTTVHLYLPRGAPPALSARRQGAAPAGRAGTVLVIDDEEQISRLARKILERQGYRVHTALSGEEGLEILARERGGVDVVLLDLTMPKMPGAAVMEKILEIAPDTRVVISSGQGDAGAGDGPLSKARGFVRKPYRVEDLAGAVRTALAPEPRDGEAPTS